LDAPLALVEQCGNDAKLNARFTIGPKEPINMQPDIVVPVLVWREADYQRALELSKDAMPATFRAWQQQLTKAKRGLPPGAVIIEIEADPDEVANWCARNGLRNTTENRARWVLGRFMGENRGEDG
jgi:hypothetical protein